MRLTTNCKLVLALAFAAPLALAAQDRPPRPPKVAAPVPPRVPRAPLNGDDFWTDTDKSTRWNFEFDRTWRNADFGAFEGDRAFMDLKRDARLDWRSSHEDAQREVDRALRDAQWEAERAVRDAQLESNEAIRDAQRDGARIARENARDLSRTFALAPFDGRPATGNWGRGGEREWEFSDKLYTAPALGWGLSTNDGLVPPMRWLGSQWHDDPADSLYRQAREMLNRGEWRRAASIFREIPAKYPNSACAPDALYWQAFALYRIGGSAELRDAIGVLDAQRGKYPGARTQSDASALATRIRGALAARGDAQAAAQISKTASDSTTKCDQEELAVRIEALSSLSQADPDGAAPILQKVLARRDECSVQLRRNAVFLLVSKKRDAATIAQLTQVAKNDPSPEVKAAAVEWMSRISGEEVVSTLEELAKSSDDERVQRAAVRGLMMNPTPRARAAVRALVERNDTPERLRAEALGSFSGERATSEDVAWLRSMYSKTNNARMQARIVDAVSRIGGSESDQWLLSLARNADEDSEVRGIALRRVSRSLGISDLGKLYDQSADRTSREMLIRALSERAEPEATDKLIEIVKSGTDPQLRRSAIAALSRKKDPRTTRLLMEIVDR